MSVLPEAKASEKLYLPSTEGLPEDQRDWVTIKDMLMFDDMGSIVEAKAIDREFDVKVAYVAALVTDWSYTNPDGTPAPVTVDNVRYHLKMQDGRFLIQKVNEILGLTPTSALNDEQKKTSTDTLMPSLTAAPVISTE